MKLSQIKALLRTVDRVSFKLPNGELVPAHFHVTEVGKITKNFIDCGGTIRNEALVGFQLWIANDTEHSLKPQKLINIIELSEEKLQIEDNEVEVEYQGTTIGKYGIGFDGTHFLLLNKQTDCLAKDNCGIPIEKQKVQLVDLSSSGNTCTPGGGCC